MARRLEAAEQLLAEKDARLVQWEQGSVAQHKPSQSFELLRICTQYILPVLSPSRNRQQMELKGKN